MGTGHSTLRNGGASSALGQQRPVWAGRANLSEQVPSLARNVQLCLKKHCSNVPPKEPQTAPQHQRHTQHASHPEAHQVLPPRRSFQAGILAQPKCLRRIQINPIEVQQTGRIWLTNRNPGLHCCWLITICWRRSSELYVPPTWEFHVGRGPGGLLPEVTVWCADKIGTQRLQLRPKVRRK